MSAAWHRRAKCAQAGVNPDLPWTSVKAALALCEECPVITACRKDMLASEPSDWQWRYAAVRAGLTPQQRRRTARSAS